MLALLAMKTGGVRVVSVGYLRYRVCFLGLMLAAGAGAVEVQRPAPARAQPVPAAHCRFLMPTEGGRYALYRSLDSGGRLLQQSAQWVDAFTGNPAATVTLSVEWRSRDYMFELPMGMANFYLRGSQANDHPLQLRFLRADGSIAKAVEAGPGYSQPNHATAYLRVGELLSAIG